MSWNDIALVIILSVTSYINIYSSFSISCVEVLQFYLSKLLIILCFPYLWSLVVCKHNLYLHCKNDASWH